MSYFWSFYFWVFGFLQNLPNVPCSCRNTKFECSITFRFGDKIVRRLSSIEQILPKAFFFVVNLDLKRIIQVTVRHSKFCPNTHFYLLSFYHCRGRRIVKQLTPPKLPTNFVMVFFLFFFKRTMYFIFINNFCLITLK